MWDHRFPNFVIQTEAKHSTALDYCLLERCEAFIKQTENSTYMVYLEMAEHVGHCSYIAQLLGQTKQVELQDHIFKYSGLLISDYWTNLA